MAAIIGEKEGRVSISKKVGDPRSKLIQQELETNKSVNKLTCNRHPGCGQRAPRWRAEQAREAAALRSSDQEDLVSERRESRSSVCVWTQQSSKTKPKRQDQTQKESHLNSVCFVLPAPLLGPGFPFFCAFAFAFSFLRGSAQPENSACLTRQ